MEGPIVFGAAGIGTLVGVWLTVAGLLRPPWERPSWRWHLVRIVVTAAFGLWAYLTHHGWLWVPAGSCALGTLMWLFRHITSYFSKRPRWADRTRTF